MPTGSSLVKGQDPGVGFSASPTMNQLQDPTVREDVALGLRTITGSNTGTDTSKLCVFGEIP